ncbi:hypothetical protein [Streptomyces sp. NPDC002491]
MTEAGAALGPALAELRDWAERYLPEGRHGSCRGAAAGVPGE